MASRIMDHFADLPDPRRQAGQRHFLSDILAIAICAVVRGADEFSAERIATAVRNHWRIENSLHWSLDVSFHEDMSRVRTGHAAENLSRVRRIALNLLKAETVHCKRGIKTKRLRAGWDHDYLLRVLQLQNAVALGRHRAGLEFSVQSRDTVPFDGLIERPLGHAAPTARRGMEGDSGPGAGSGAAAR
jgi:hypothetical protein